jgi:hypothetical protein
MNTQIGQWLWNVWEDAQSVILNVSNAEDWEEFVTKFNNGNYDEALAYLDNMWLTEEEKYMAQMAVAEARAKNKELELKTLQGLTGDIASMSKWIAIGGIGIGALLLIYFLNKK